LESILQQINSPDDVKKLTVSQLEKLASEIREFLIDKVSKTGGHLASNLGIVELTLVLHKIFNLPEDKIIWDVGHQSYVHKILTGRKESFDTLRKLNGLAGFPKISESEYDCFNTGHSSTSISAAIGFARARDLKNEKHSVVAVIGDGALTGGMAFEALNDAGRSSNNLIVVLNDNEMSITENVGGLSRYLSKIRTDPRYSKAKEDINSLLSKLPLMGKSMTKALERAKGTIKYIVMHEIIFEELGFKYLGPIDGHNIEEMTKVFSRAKLMKGPIFVHVCTQKGKGYSFAEDRPEKYHGISPFEVETGEVKSGEGLTFSGIFGKEIVNIARKDNSVVAISAAMVQGTGLENFAAEFPDRFYDVGIAEQHAVTMAAGMARSGLKPVVALYSSFLQRSYDQILHDVALQNLHVVFAIDRAGVVGEDGETHQGLYDLSFLRHIPNIVIAAPCDYSEFAMMLEYAITKHEGPIAIRYPKGIWKERLYETGQLNLGKGVKMRTGKDVTVAAVGSMVKTALEVSEILENVGIDAEVINARFVKPLDSSLLINSVSATKKLVTLEDNVIKGGFGSGVLELLSQNSIYYPVKIFGFPDEPILHGSRKEIFRKYKMDAQSIAEEVKRFVHNKSV